MEMTSPASASTAANRVAVPLRLRGYAGEYVWHCHILEHEANEMMRPYRIVL